MGIGDMGGALVVIGVQRIEVCIEENTFCIPHKELEPLVGSSSVPDSCPVVIVPVLVAAVLV